MGTGYVLGNELLFKPDRGPLAETVGSFEITYGTPLLIFEEHLLCIGPRNKIVVYFGLSLKRKPNKGLSVFVFNRIVVADNYAGLGHDKNWGF